MTLDSGTQLGHYEIAEQIGKGGMGEVYRARDTKLGREVAIKVLPAEFAKDEERIARLEREARMLAALNHPNIAAIHGLEQSDDTLFLVLELVEGDTLADKIKTGPIKVAEALKLALQIAEALEAAHEKGIIHRDLKPANIKITPDGRAKLLDFGLAKAFSAERSDVNLSNTPTLSMTATQPGVVIGTAGYMSPEQARGELIGVQTDIWALGCLLFEMLTGKAAFGRDTLTETLARVLERDPDFDDLPAELPPLIRRLIERCLKKNVRERLHHVADARVEILDAQNDEARTRAGNTTARPAAPHAGSAWNWLLGFALLLLGVGLAGTWYSLRSGDEGVRLPTTRLNIGPIASPDSLFSRDIAISPDGTNVAYVSGRQLWLRPLSEERGRPIFSGQSGGTPSNPFFSPDGQWLAFSGEGGLYKLPVSGAGAPTLISPISETGAEGRLLGAAWGDDGTIVYATGAGLHRVSPEADEPSPGEVVIPSPDSGVYAWPEFVNGNRLVVSRISEGPIDANEIVMIDLEARSAKSVQRGGVGPRWAMTENGGLLVYATTGGLAVVGFDPVTGSVEGAPVVISGTEVRIDGTYSPAAFAISDTGTLVRFPRVGGFSQAWLIWVDPNDGTEEIINDSIPGRLTGYARVSPDGKRIAVNADAGSGRRVWVLDLERGNSWPISQGTFEDILPQWSFDGSRIFYASNLGGGFRVYSRAADGSGRGELVVDHQSVNMPYRAMPQNQLLFYSGEGRGGSGLLALDEPGNIRLLFDGVTYREVNAVVSPDGNWVAHESDESGRLQVYVNPFPDVGGQRVQVSIDGGVQPLWDPRGASVLYYRSLDESGAQGAIMAQPVEFAPDFRPVGPPRQLIANNRYVGGGNWSYDVSPSDGRFLFVQTAEPTSNQETIIQVTLNWFEELRARVPVN